jgi:hypothetical protein
MSRRRLTNRVRKSSFAVPRKSPAGLNRSFNGYIRNDKADVAIQALLELLRKEYLPLHPKSKIDAQRYYPDDIWLRILDKEFESQELTERGKDIWLILGKLPDSIHNQLSMVFFIAPSERRWSAANLEFEDPHPFPLD